MLEIIEVGEGGLTLSLSNTTSSWHKIESVSCSTESDLLARPVAELDIFVPQGGRREEFDLGVELRCSPVDLKDERLSFTFGIQKGQLQLLLTNCVIPAGSPRYGDQQPPPTICRSVKREFETQEEQTKVRGFGSSVTIKNNGPQARLSAKSDKTNRAQHINRESKTDEENDWFVRPSTGNAWDIQEPKEGELLYRKYLGDEVLCNIKSESYPFEIIAQFNVKARDFDVKDIRERSWLSTLSINKQKIIKRAISKMQFIKDDKNDHYTIDIVKIKSSE